MFLPPYANVSLCRGAQFSHYSHNYHMLVFVVYIHEEAIEPNYVYILCPLICQKK